jgi:hypothetical protein
MDARVDGASSALGADAITLFNGFAEARGGVVGRGEIASSVFGISDDDAEGTPGSATVASESRGAVDWVGELA